MNAHSIDWIWRIRGSLALAPGQSGDEAFGRLDPLFRESGTSHERTSDTLTFRKRDQAAQDKMSIFDDGILQIKDGVAGAVLHYQLTSRALLFCFLAPLLFLFFAQVTVVLGKWEKTAAHAAGKAAKKPDKKEVALPQSPIDKALGAPAPEKPKKDANEGGEENGKKPSPTPAYVFAALFAVLYVVGRVLEARLVRSLFTKRLLAA